MVDKRKNEKRKFKLGDLVGIADKKNVFSKADATNWSKKLPTPTQINIETIPHYRIINLRERYNEELPKKSDKMGQN